MARARPLLGLALVAWAAVSPAARAEEPARPGVQAGLRWLVAQQAPDGSFGKHNKLALTGMSGLALLASGSTPRRGQYAPAIARALEFVLSCQKERAFVHASSGYSAIHNHGYALLFVTQCYGEAGPLDARLETAIRRAVQATVGSQFKNGGFSYFLWRQVVHEHRDMWRDDEASTTVSQIQALRGARDAGFYVQFGALERAAKYIAESQHQPTGGFVYSIGSTPRRISFEEGSDVPTFAITAAASAVLHALGTYEGPVVERGLQYVEGFLPPTRRRLPFFYYGHYYAAQVMHMLGGPRGERWMNAVLAELTQRQHRDGYWPTDPQDSLDAGDSKILNTAWALQVAQIDRCMLPIHER